MTPARIAPRAGPDSPEVCGLAAGDVGGTDVGVVVGGAVGVVWGVVEGEVVVLGVVVGEAAVPCWVVNAKVPETGCPSAEVTRHSTV
jgi:hypothetical protein